MPIYIYTYAHIYNYLIGANFDEICQHVSHIIFFSLEPNSKGDIVGFDRFPSKTVLKDSLKAVERSNGHCKRLICFGGNGRSSGFSAMTRNKVTMKKFVTNVVHLIRQYGFDGVDYNWEYPGYEFGRGYGQLMDVEKDYSGLANLISETRRQFNSINNKGGGVVVGDDKRLVITMAYYPDGKQERMLFRGKIHKKVDYLHMMTYDQNGGMHSTYEFTAKAVKQAIDAELPPEKLTIGLPFYGRHSQSGDWTTYEDILRKYHDSLGRELDVVPAFDSNDDSFIGFNNQATIVKKTNLALQLGLGGVMIWEVCANF
jgi:GH18 family chitinase